MSKYNDAMKLEAPAGGLIAFFERALAQYPDREAYGDAEHSFTWEETGKYAKRIAGVIAAKHGTNRRPVVVYMEKCIEAIASFWGVLNSGNFYCPIDVEMPADRIRTIMNVLKPECIITDRAHFEQAEEFANEIPRYLWEDLTEDQTDTKLPESILQNITDDDPLYVLFTSGSTGIPKGVVVSHRVIKNYLLWLDNNYSYDCHDVFGNQAPLYFDVSAHDIFAAAFFGAKMEIIPPYLFGFPLRLIQYLNEKKITAFMWVPSAMVIVAKLKTFRAEKPQYLKHVMFAGEVLPRKYLDYWASNLPDVLFSNFYGPTETFVCTAYDFQGDEPEGEPLPIGKPLSNCGAVILNENDEEAAENEIGELCLRGSCLALGYYNNEEKTKQSFTQNPLNHVYPERIYRTGDLVRLNGSSDLEYVSRKDFQIKHMGYRIELGEIETAAGLIEGIEECACVYDDKRKNIILCYDGKKQEEDTLVRNLKERIPVYMVPDRFYYQKKLPHNANGKIDRKQLKEECTG